MRAFIAILAVTMCIAAVALGAGEKAKKAKASAEPTDTNIPHDAEEIRGTFTVENPVLKELVECRERKGYGTLEIARCYERAITYMNTNVSMHSSLSLLYMKSDLIAAAKQIMNRTVSLWLDSVASLIPDSEKGNTSYVDLLRLAYDDARNRSDDKARDLTVEMGLVLTKKFELEHKPSDAHAIYYGFLAQLGVGLENLIDFHRRTGNIVALVHTGNTTGMSIPFRLAEAIPPIIDGFTTHIMSYGHIGVPIRRMCGIEFTQSDEVVARDIVRNLEQCVERWGNYTEALDEEEEHEILKPYSVLKWTSLHRLSALNAAWTLEKTLTKLGETMIPADRFGRGLVHYAASSGAAKSLEYLVQTDKRSVPWEKEDKGKIQPAHIGCTSPLFHDEFEELTRKGACDGLIRNKFEDPNIDVTDDTGNDAGWNPQKKKKGENPHCDIDIRDASKLFQHDLNLAYMMANHPIVLRNVFFEEEDGPREEWRRRGFNKTFHDVLIRQEVTPMGERYGIGSAKVVSISEFLNTSKINDGTVGNVVVDSPNHRLEKVAGWIPPTLTKKKSPTEVTYFDVNAASPTLIVNKIGSKSHHHVRAFMSFHTVYYGQIEFHMLPPVMARSVRGQLPDKLKPLALRCNLQTGDVLVLPELWSMSWISKANGLSVERYFYRSGEQD